MSDLHVVLGAGQVGPRLAARLLEQGKRVRMVRRGAWGDEAPEGAERARADLSRVEEGVEACRGAAVIYDCTNPSGYGSWHETLPPLKLGILEVAKETGAFLVTLDNLYSYGRPAGALDESTPMDPCSEKGELRARLANQFLEAAARGEVRGAIGRASDFFGPGAGKMSFYGDPTVRAIAAGWGAPVLGDPNLPRSYSYVPDVVRGLEVLGSNPELSDGKVFHLPVAHKSESSRALVERFAAELGVKARTYPLPRWFFRLAGIFSRDLGAMVEMLYQWEMPYVVDDSHFVQTFGVEATPIELAVRCSVEAHARPGRPALSAGR